MLMACIPIPGSAWHKATLALASLRAYTTPSERQRSGHSHGPSFASHVAIQRDRARLMWVIDLLLNPPAQWWLYACSPLSIGLVVLLCSINMSRELATPHLLDTIAITNKKSAPEGRSGSAYFPRRGVNMFLPTEYIKSPCMSSAKKHPRHHSSYNHRAESFEELGIVLLGVTPNAAGGRLTS
jgi:hypothetical protein